MRIVLMVLMFVIGISANTKYYIDFSGGNDANNGTSKSTPWKHMRGMNGKFAGTYTWAANDTFVFKGGVTWDSTCFPDTIGGAGSVSGLTITVDSTWYNGGSYSKPVFDIMEKPTGTAFVDASIYAWYKKRFTINGIEIKNAKAPSGRGNATVFYLYGSDTVLINDLYIHNWHHTTTTEGANGGVVLNDCDSVVVSNSTFTGVDSGGSGVKSIGQYGTRIHVYNCNVSHCNWGFTFTALTTSIDVHDNDVSYLVQGQFDATAHTDGIICVNNTSGRGKIWNNRFHDLTTVSIMMQKGNWRVYNNEISNVDKVSASAIGSVGISSTSNGVDCSTCSLEVYNNYIDGGFTHVLNIGNPKKIGYVAVKNNIITLRSVISDTIAVMDHDNNLYTTDTTGSVYPWYLYGVELNRVQALANGFDTNLIVSASPGISSSGAPSSEASLIVGVGIDRPSWLTADANAVLWGDEYGIGPYKWVDETFPANRKMRMILR